MTNTHADEIRKRLAALLDVDELAAVDRSMSALRTLHALIVMEGDLNKLTPLTAGRLFVAARPCRVGQRAYLVRSMARRQRPRRSVRAARAVGGHAA